MSSPALDRMLRVTALYDLYGGLLTGRQREFLQLHYMRDLSLAEISEQHGVSRQSVHDTLNSAESSLERVESSLGLLGRLKAARSAADGACRRCEELDRLLKRREASATAVRPILECLMEDLCAVSDSLGFGPSPSGD